MRVEGKWRHNFFAACEPGFIGGGIWTWRNFMSGILDVSNLKVQRSFRGFGDLSMSCHCQIAIKGLQSHLDRAF